MYYPFVLFRDSIEHRPIFPGLQGDPFVADLSYQSQLLKHSPARDQKAFQEILEQVMASDHQWGFSPYLERRDTLLADCPQMAAEKRFYHLGMDIIVPVNTPLCAPLKGVVVESGYEAGEGNYGAFVLLRHEEQRSVPFYSLYGHLSRQHLPNVGQTFKAGEIFCRIGDFSENGNWFHHTHLQVITEKGLAEGYLSKGYCTEGDLVNMNDLCPSPVPLFRR
ncbi:MAG: hypothetical protein D6B25_15360 [Desulfobulbaceae bacterium]|nr:MAG: hypothetical protein D6B25_15360 [Desulfobulbaceae bacterium]